MAKIRRLLGRMLCYRIASSTSLATSLASFDQPVDRRRPQSFVTTDVRGGCYFMRNLGRRRGLVRCGGRFRSGALLPQGPSNTKWLDVSLAPPPLLVSRAVNVIVMNGA